MCGFNIAYGPDALERVTLMNEALKHRGLYSNVRGSADFAMGHVRLPIVGLDREFDQPYKDSRGNYFLFAGEILDFRETHPKAKCDVELLEELWDKYGFKEREGFWSVVRHDTRTGYTSFLTDFLNKKPIYFRIAGGKVAGVSSEVKALLPLGPNAPNENYFSQVIKFGYPLDPVSTPVDGIHKMRRGTRMTINCLGQILGMDEGADHMVQREQPRDLCNPTNVRKVIELSVKRRVLSSDVPVAFLLSGGLDSTIVFRLARRWVDKPKVFFVDNGEDARFINEACDGCEVTQIYPEGVERDEAVKINDGPADMGSLFPQIALAKAIHRQAPEVRVVLSGDGADELFGGYSRATRYDSQASDVFDEIVNYHAPRLDKTMMSQTLELRCPFLGRDVLRLALGVPYDLRTSKQLLKAAFVDIVPQSIIERPKLALRSHDVKVDRETNTRHLCNIYRQEIFHERHRR